MDIRKAGVWLGLVEQDDEVLYDEGEEIVEAAEAQVVGARRYGWEPPPPVAVPPPGDGVSIAVVTPQTFRDAHTIGEYFRQDLPVVIDLHDLDMAAAKRIVDFASGLIFGRHGAIERLSGRMFLILPSGSTLLRGREAVVGTEFYNQA